MSNQAHIETIKRLLQSELLLDCRSALEDARQLLANGEDSLPLLALLQEVSETHHYATIQNLAHKIYQEYTTPETQSKSADKGEQVPVVCPTCQCTNYFNKMILCSSTILYRGPQLSRVKLYGKCINCDFNFTDHTIDIDCEQTHG